MHLVSHQIRYDVTSLVRLVGAWFGVLAIQSLVLWMGPPVPDDLPGPPVSLDIAAIVMRVALTVVFVSALVQRNPVTGTTAFWRTRPLPRRYLLASVGLTLGVLFVALPAAWGAVTYRWLGLDTVSALRGAAMLAVEQWLAVSVALALASVTRNLAQVIVAAVLVPGVTGIASFLLRQIAVPSAWRLGLGVEVPFSAEVNAVVLLVWSVLLVGVAAHQYLTLRWIRSLVLGGLLALLFGWHPPLIVRWTNADLAARSARVDGPQPTLVRSSLRTDTDVRHERGKAVAYLRISGRFETPAGSPVALRPVRVVSRMTFADGRVVTSSSGRTAMDAEGTPASSDATRRWNDLATVRGTSRVAPPPIAVLAHRSALFSAPLTTMAPYQALPGALAIRAAFAATGYEAATPIPLTPGSRAELPGRTLECEAVQAGNNLVTVMLRDIDLASTTAAAPFYVLVNPRRGEAVVAGVSKRTRYRSGFQYLGLPAIWRLRLEFDVDPRSSGIPLVDAAWLADARLVLLRPIPLGVVEHTFTLDDVVPASPVPAEATR